jgi:hypothetical protein
MTSSQRVFQRRTVIEWHLKSDVAYANRFSDVNIEGTFNAPSGREFRIPGFYSGANTWCLRFNPSETGTWDYTLSSSPQNAQLWQEGQFEVRESATAGYLRSTPGQAWGFHRESGEPVLILGDTTYDLFGMAHCGVDVYSFMKRRAEQGFNLLRVRVSSSAFFNANNSPIPPEDFASWHTRSTWPWGGSEQSPRFDSFNLDYFQTVDRVVQYAETLGLGLEMVMQAWGNEFPFNSRNVFVAEWEEFWLRHMIARYDAYHCVWFWTLMNEYEYYPDGIYSYKTVSDRWAMRLGQWVKHTAQHGHIVTVHNGPREPAFAKRFMQSPDAIDTIMFQDWGARDAANGWLAAGLEDQVARSMDGWWGSAVLSEFGYERNPDFPLLVPLSLYCDLDHTRRAAWRGAFCGLGLIHGFENSWGPFERLHEDQPGVECLLHLRRFFMEIIPFHQLQAAPTLVLEGSYTFGYKPLAMKTADDATVLYYLPVHQDIVPPQHLDHYAAEWFDPRTGELCRAKPSHQDERVHYTAPAGGGDRPWDWLLILRRNDST